MRKPATRARITGCWSRRLLVAVQLSVLSAWRLIHTEKIATKATTDASTTSVSANHLRRMLVGSMTKEVPQRGRSRNAPRLCARGGVRIPEVGAPRRIYGWTSLRRASETETIVAPMVDLARTQRRPVTQRTPRARG